MVVCVCQKKNTTLSKGPTVAQWCFNLCVLDLAGLLSNLDDEYEEGQAARCISSFPLHTFRLTQMTPARGRETRNVIERSNTWIYAVLRGEIERDTSIRRVLRQRFS